MLHPNNVAIKYIWERFMNAFFDKKTIEQKKEIDKIISATKHRPLNRNNSEFVKYIDNNIEAINKLKTKYINIDFVNELRHFTELKNNM